jgi:CheY-like chemotaxis protein
VKSVLVVDDDDTVREVLSYAIQQFGHEVYKASNGIEAMEILGMNSGIEVVILDLRMPKMDGYDVCPMIRNLNPDIEIIISSAFVDETKLKGLNDLGVKHILRKPYPLDLLQEIIDSHSIG